MSKANNGRIFSPTRIQYYPAFDKIVVNILPNDSKQYPKDKKYSWDAFHVYDLKSHKVTLSNIQSPPQYSGGGLDIPYIYTSQAEGKYFIASYSLDKSIVILDVSTGKIQYEKISFEEDNLHPINVSNLKKDSLKDALQKSWVIDDAYYQAFYDVSQNKFIRVYKPQNPFKVNDTSYMSYMEKPCKIIIKKNKVTQNYFLPNGIFLIPFHWYYDQKNKKLKFIKSVNTKKQLMIQKYFKYIYILLICTIFSCESNNSIKELNNDTSRLFQFLKINNIDDSFSFAVVPPLICLQCEEGLISVSTLDTNLVVYLSQNDNTPLYLKHNKIVKYDASKMRQLGLDKLYSVHYILNKGNLVYKKSLIK